VGLAAKLDGYRRRAVYKWIQTRHRAAARKREAAFQSWLDGLSAKPPEVLVGANFATYGGVRHHIQAIQRYSSMNVSLAPSDTVMEQMGIHHVAQFSDKFLEAAIPGLRTVHSHVFPWFIEWCLARQEQGLRWIHTYHLNYYPEHAIGSLESWQEEINAALVEVARHADVRLSVSRWQQEELRNIYGIETYYLPNGVDIAMCDAADSSRFARKTGLRDFLLYVGRNEPIKNPTEFVRLAECLPALDFVMIGGGLSEELLRSDLHQLVPRNLHILGSLPHASVQDAIAACSVLVVTSLREGLPTLVMEGMAHGKPIVVSNDEGCVEAIGNGEAGLIYELGNVHDLAEKTLQALADGEIGQRARNRAEREYDWHVLAPQLDRVYRGEAFV
jgi:glycosyltransferase involved in cell wall biosynthesis